MPNNNETTTRFKVDISELKKSMQEAKRQVAVANSEFKAVTSTMDDWTKSTDGISAKLTQLNSNLRNQKSILGDLERQYELTVAEMGAGSKAAQDLQIKINNQKAVVNRTEREIANFSDTLQEVEQAEREAARSGRTVAEVLNDMGREAEDSSDGFTILKGAVATFTGNVLTGLLNGLRDGVSTLMNLSEETKEYRTELAKLETASTGAGASADYIKEKWKDLNGVLNDEGAVTEGLNNLVAAGFTAEKEVDAITQGLEGAAIMFKDTLKFEGLSDSLQEWIGSDGVNLTGNFAEMLERLGYNLEDVQAKTSGMTDEQRRNWAIQTLQKEGLNELSKSYREQNADLVASNKAQLEYTDQLAAMGEKIEPVTTALKTGFSELLGVINQLLDGVDLEAFSESITEGFVVLKDEVIPALKDGFTWLRDNATPILTVIGGLVSALVTAKIVGIITSIITVVTGLVAKAKALGGVMAVLKVVIAALGGPVTLIISLIAGLVTAFVVLWKKSDAFRNFWINLWNNIKLTVANIGVYLKEFFTVKIPKFIDTAIGFFKTLPERIGYWLGYALGTLIKWGVNLISWARTNIPKFISNVITYFSQLPGKIWTWLKNTISKLNQWKSDMGVKGKEAIKNLIDNVISGAKDIPSKMLSIGKNIVDGVWSGIKNAKDTFFKESVKGFFGGLVDGAKDSLGIKSPSKVFANEVGKWIPPGVAQGVKKNSKVALDSVKALASDMVSSAIAGLSGGVVGMVGSTAGGVVNNFTQIINSPKQLSRLDIYRQSKNLLGYAGGGH